MSLKNPVRTLPSEVARKIAAGEVIDRPNAIIRELMDNAIDSGASSITVEINGGGIEKIRIIDNGCGMTKEDLQNCARPHTTSKISSEVDLMNLTTLGFRGEALASIAAVSRLSIISGGWKMCASITQDHELSAVAPTKGTIVQAEGLFENYPARRQFLKRPATEGMMCKNTFIEKVMARPDIGFKFVQDGVTKINLPENQSLKERFVMANNYKEPAELFYQFGNYDAVQLDDSKTPDWSFEVVMGEPSVSRSNKKEIFIYANGRRIQEYSLVQAVEYGGQGYFPNGTFPVATVFIKVDPKLIDFNIHPAKREARFSDIASIHHGISSTIKQFLLNYTRRNFENNETADNVGINEFTFETSPSAFETLDSKSVIKSPLCEKGVGGIDGEDKDEEDKLERKKAVASDGESSELKEASVSGVAGEAFDNKDENENGEKENENFLENPEYASFTKAWEKSFQETESENDKRSAILSIRDSDDSEDDDDIGTSHLDKIGAIAHQSSSLNYKDNTSGRNIMNELRSYHNFSGYQKIPNEKNYNRNYQNQSTRNLADQIYQSQQIKDEDQEVIEERKDFSGIDAKTYRPSRIRYIGACLGTFLLAEKDNCLYIIDQHAAHERILFDKLMSSQSKAKRQKLLIPYNISTDSDAQDKLMEKLSSELSRIGFENENQGDGKWVITSIPERWTGTEYELRNLIFSKQVDPAQIIRAIAAMTSCKAAIKDGYIIDSVTATELINQAFKLDDPHCPHGRPIYTVISRETLFQLVKRT